MQSFTSVPFKTESGLSQVNGVAKFSSAGIVLEFESKLFGLIGNGVKEVRLHLAEILDIKFRKGVFRAQNIVSEMQKYLTEQADSLPPPHTPLASLFADEQDDATKELR